MTVGYLELIIEGLPTEVEVAYEYSWEPGYSPEIEDCTLAGTPIMGMVEARRELVEHLVQQALANIERKATELQDKIDEAGDMQYQIRKEERG